MTGTRCAPRRRAPRPRRPGRARRRRSPSCARPARRLDDSGEAELRRRRGRGIGVVGDPLRDDRHPVGLEQLARLGGVEPDSSAARERRSTTRARVGASTPVERRHGPERAAQPLGAPGRAAERTSRRLRVGERGDGRPARSAAGTPVGRHDDREHRLVRRRSPSRRVDRGRDLVRGRAHGGTKSTIDGVHAAGRPARPAAPPRRSPPSPSRACRPGSRRSPRRAAAAPARRRSPRQRRQLEAGRVAGVRAEDAEPAGVREHCDAAAARHRLRESSAATSISSSSARRGSRRPGGRGHRRPLPSPRARPCASSQPLAGRGGAALQREDRLRAGDARAIRPNRRGLPNDSRYSSTTLVSGSSSHHSSRSFEETSALFPIETNAERPSPRESGRLEQRQAQRPALGGEADVPRGAGGREGRVQAAAPATAMPRQFGPIRRPPWERTSASSRSCALGALARRSRRSRPRSRRARARRLRARPRPRRARARRHADDGQVDGLRDLRDGARTPRRRRRRPVAVDGVGGAANSAARMLRKSSPPIEPRRGDAPSTATLAGAKNGRSDATTATWSRSSTRARYALGRRDREPDLDRPALEPACQLEARGLEDPEHRAVLGQHLGHEALDAAAAAAPRAAPAAACRSRGPAARLRPRRRPRPARVAQAHVAADRDDPLAVPSSSASVPTSAPRPPVGLEERLHELRPRPGTRGSAGRGSRREPAEEREQRVRVLAPRRSQPQRPAVAEDDVDGSRNARWPGHVTPPVGGHLRTYRPRVMSTDIANAKARGKQKARPFTLTAGAARSRPTRWEFFFDQLRHGDVAERAAEREDEEADTR